MLSRMAISLNIVISTVLMMAISSCHAMEVSPQKQLIEARAEKFIQDLEDINGIKLEERRRNDVIKGIVEKNNLDIYDAGLKILPESVGTLIHLTEINLSSNKMETLPSAIGNLQNLKTINVGYNQLTKLPPEIGKLSKLEALTVSNNRLKKLPSEIGSLRSLKDLFLSNNQLTALPSEIAGLINLEYLVSDKNQLKSLPNNIFQLKNLVRIGLANNLLKELPAGIEALENLQRLEVAHNLLETVPTGIGMLQKLTYIGLNNNNLTVLPLELMQAMNPATQLWGQGNPLHKPFQTSNDILNINDVKKYFSPEEKPNSQALLSQVPIDANFVRVPYENPDQAIPNIPLADQGIPMTLVSATGKDSPQGTIVFLHGGPQLAVHEFKNEKFVLQDKFRELARQFAAKGFQVAMIDIRGSNIKNYPYQANYQNAYSLYDQKFANDIEAVVDYFKKKNPDLPVYGVMHSFGGYHGMISMVSKPDLFDKVVMLAPSIGYAIDSVTLLYELYLQPLKEKNLMKEDWKIKIEIESKRAMGDDWEPGLDPLFSEEVYKTIEPINTFCSDNLKNVPIMWVHNQDDKQVFLPMAADFLAKAFDHFNIFQVIIGNRGGHTFFELGSDAKIYIFYVKEIANFLRGDLSLMPNKKYGRIVNFDEHPDNPVTKSRFINSGLLKSLRNNSIFKFKQDAVEPFTVDQAFNMIAYMHSQTSHQRIAEHMQKELNEIITLAEQEGWPDEDIKNETKDYEQWIKNMKKFG